MLVDWDGFQEERERQKAFYKRQNLGLTKKCPACGLYKCICQLSLEDWS